MATFEFEDDAPPATMAERIDDVLIWLDRHRQRPDVAITIAAAVLVLIAAAWWLGRSPHVTAVDELIPQASLVPSTFEGGQEQDLIIHVTGAVADPGVFMLSPGSRVLDAVDAAGGVTEEADSQQVNLAAQLNDGAQIRIPLIGEYLAQGRDDSGERDNSGPININTASAALLEELPGIGPATAEAIAVYREEHGAFAVVEDLQGVPGIGPAKLAGLLDKASVR